MTDKFRIPGLWQAGEKPPRELTERERYAIFEKEMNEKKQQEEKHQKLLAFVWKTFDLSFCPDLRKQEYCDCAGCEAGQLLKEIGELK